MGALYASIVRGLGYLCLGSITRCHPQLAHLLPVAQYANHAHKLLAATALFPYCLLSAVCAAAGFKHCSCQHAARNTVLLCSRQVVSILALCAGDGAGILVSMPESFLIRVTAELGIDLPPRQYYGVGMVYLPTDDTLRAQVKATMMEVRPATPFYLHTN